jgi:hypothetical protein
MYSYFEVKLSSLKVHSEKLTKVKKIRCDSLRRNWHGGCFYRCVTDIEGMKKLVVVLLLTLVVNVAFSYTSGIAIQTDKASKISVFVNGKLYNKQPGKFVRIKSHPGLFHVQVKVFNPYDRSWYFLKKNITAQKGFEMYYKVILARGKKPQLQEMRKYPVYTKYFLNPVLYNKHPVS